MVPAQVSVRSCGTVSKTDVFCHLVEQAECNQAAADNVAACVQCLVARTCLKTSMYAAAAHLNMQALSHSGDTTCLPCLAAVSAFSVCGLAATTCVVTCARGGILEDRPSRVKPECLDT